MRALEAYPRAASAPAPLVPRPLRHGHQHRRPLLPLPALRLRLLPADHARRPQHDELEQSHVRRHDPVRHGVLSDLWPEAVYTARVPRQERGIRNARHSWSVQVAARALITSLLRSCPLVLCKYPPINLRAVAAFSAIRRRLTNHGTSAALSPAMSGADR